MNIMHKFLSVTKRNLPTILTVGNCIGVPATAYFTGKAVLEAEKYLNSVPEEDLKKVATKLHVAKIYGPAVISGFLTIGMGIGSNVSNKKIQAGYVAAYSVLSSAFNTWKNKLPVEEEMRIESEVDKDRVDAEIEKLLNQRPDEQYELWVDDFRKRPFWARKSDILLGKDEINKQLSDPNFSRHWGTASLEEFYAHVKGEPEPQDYLYGWDIDYIYEKWESDQVDVDWTENYIYIEPVSGKKIPCNHIWWSIDPLMNYWNYESQWEQVGKPDSRN